MADEYEAARKRGFPNESPRSLTKPALSPVALRIPALHAGPETPAGRSKGAPEGFGAANSLFTYWGDWRRVVPSRPPVTAHWAKFSGVRFQARSQEAVQQPSSAQYSTSPPDG